MEKTVLILSGSTRKTTSGKPFVTFSCRDEDGKEWTGCKIWDSNKVPEGQWS